MFTSTKPTKHRPFIVNFAAAAIVVFTIPMAAVVTVARIEKVAPIPDLPERYRPGKPLPSDAACPKGRVDLWHVNCEASHLGHRVHFTIQGSSMTIISSSIWMADFTIGDLILAWGMPTGFARNRYFINVYWGQRYALLLTETLRPDSRVKMVVYTRVDSPALPWHGFASENSQSKEH
jgi:hypothetical protein